DWPVQKRVPERTAVRGIERHEIVGRTSGEEHVAGGAQQARPYVVSPPMGPSNSPSLVLDRLDHRFRPAAALSAAPAHGIVAGIEQVIDAVAPHGAHIEK